jgi:hypothetical protein
MNGSECSSRRLEKKSEYSRRFHSTTTHEDGYRLGSLTPHDNGYPRRRQGPHDIPLGYHNQQSEHVGAENNAKTSPRMPRPWGSWIPSKTQGDPKVGCCHRPLEMNDASEDVIAHIRQYGNNSIIVNARKKRIGACMKAASSGRSRVAGW